MSYNKDGSRILWVDWIKALSVVGVVLIHILISYMNTYPYRNAYPIFSFNWLVTVGFASLPRFAVPLFVMASGFLILRKEEPISNVYRRFKRILIPFLFWMVIYVAFFYFYVNGGTDIGGFLYAIIKGVFKPTSASFVFWFVYMILCLYLLAPILSKWILNSNFSEIQYFLAIWAFSLLINFVSILTGHTTEIYQNLHYFAEAIGYFVLGYYLAFKDSKYLRSRKLGLMLYILGTLIAFIGTILYTYFVGGSYPFFLHADYTPNACLQAIGLFIIFKNTNLKNMPDKINNITVLFSLSSYGSYLAHYLVIVVVLMSIPLFPLSAATVSNYSPLLSIPLFTALAVVITILVIYIMSKIPFLKHFSGIKYSKIKN